MSQEEAQAGNRPSRAAYQAQRRKASVTLYFNSPAQMGQYRELAEAGGYAHNFNGWILQAIANAVGGNVYPAGYVEGLRRDADRTKGWLETAREENADYRAQLKLLQRHRDMLLALLHGLPDGPEAAARFLEQASQQEVRV